jgi:CrcB protein
MARYGLSGWIAERSKGTFPWGTLVVNLSACLLLGAFLGAPTADWPAPSEHLVVIGFLGGCTTFSTLCFETHALLAKVERRSAAWNVFGNVIGGILAVALGRWMGGFA